MLIMLNVAYSNPPKSCKVLHEPDPNSNNARFTDINKTIKSCIKAIQDYPDEVQYWYELGSAYASSINFSTEKAFPWYLKAAEAGHASAQYEIGRIYQWDKPYKDKKKALYWYKKAADNNDSSAQYELAGMYRNGEGGKKDINSAIFWYKKAADSNKSDASFAQMKLGDMYYEGKDVHQDYAKAMSWYKKVSENNNIAYWSDEHAEAQDKIAEMYYYGQGVKKSYKKAFKWFMKAAEENANANQGYINYAKTMIGFMYSKGWGVRKNNKKSFEWFMKAAMQGDEKAQAIVGSSYYEGNGVKKNYIKAYSWLNLVLSKDIEENTRSEAERVFKILEVIMTPEQIEIAQNYDPLKQKTETENHTVSKNAKSSQRYTGTGFFVDKSTVLTNHHVVQDCKRIELIRKGYKSIAKIKAKDSVNDLALLDANTANDSSLNFRTGKGIRIGESVIVIGYPLGELLGSGIKLTTGNVSALTGLVNDTTNMQLTAPVQPGSSGGPLLDKSGNVVGIIVARLKKGQNVNLAIKSNVAQMFLDINSIDYAVSMSKDKKDVADIADEAKDSIVQVVCYQ